MVPPVEDSPTPRGAIVLGVLLAAAGIAPILSGLGLIALRPTADTPGWIAVCAGAVFVLGGAAVINGYAIAGGAAPNGDLPANTPFVVRAVQYVLGLSIVALMTTISGWIAFGPGERQFSTSSDSTFVSHHSSGSGIGGRIAFGIGTMVMVAFFVALAVKAVRDLRGARRASRGI